MFGITEGNVKAPLYLVLARVAALWTLADAGYFLILPALGFDLSYNSASTAIAVYFLVWAAIIIWYFWDIFSAWLPVDSRIWVYVAFSLGFATLLGGLLNAFSYLPTLQGPVYPPYTDLLFAKSWYFLPKSTEILVQQLLITVIVLVYSTRYRSLWDVIVGYAVIFGGAHIVIFLASEATTQYALIMTTAALFSALVFPYCIVRIRSGFVVNYMIHLSFYVLLALVLHAWPPPGYVSM